MDFKYPIGKIYGCLVMGDIKDWVPLFSQLVWPVFILTIAFLFKQQCIAVFTQISKEYSPRGAVGGAVSSLEFILMVS